MKIKSNAKLLSYFIIFLAIDQILKYIVIKYYSQLVYYNNGIFFGFIKSQFFVWICLIIGLGLLIYLFVSKKIKSQVLIALIFAGAISNIVDRIIYPGVVDYIKLADISRFNLADAYIVLAVGIYLFQVTKKQSKI